MSDVSTEPTIIREVPKDTPKTFKESEGVREMGDMLAEMRRGRVKESEKPTTKADETPTSESADTATEVDNELPAETGDADQTETTTEPGKNEGKDAEAEKLTPIERPRSWTKDDDDEWNALPRARQEKIVANERARETDINRRMTEAAEKAKTLATREQAAEQTRAQYESKLASVREILENEQRRDFPDIKSQQDLDNIGTKIRDLSAKAQQLWATDPLAAGPLQAEAMQLQGTLQAWDNHQRKLQALDREQKQADQRKTTEGRDAWLKHVQEQNALAAEKIPDLKDAEKGKVLRERVVETLTQLGFTTDELNNLANGQEKISLFDHRLQQLYHNSLRLADIEKARKTVAAKVAAKPVPAVVKPGTSQSSNPVESQSRKALETKLSKSGKMDDAVAVLMARRAARR